VPDLGLLCVTPSVVAFVPLDPLLPKEIVKVTFVIIGSSLKIVVDFTPGIEYFFVLLL
jgi:hypothetical protein